MARWQLRCVEHIDQYGYQLVSIVIDDSDGQQWPSVQALIDDGRAEIVVVADQGHPPPNRLPRIEVAGEEPTVNLRRWQAARRPRITGR